ncbi:MAG TPA: DMT family transporter [Cyclobacteriaceae bacterium]|nr:DMT family transporter [Cyclobacteriaceae bacterium]
MHTPADYLKLHFLVLLFGFTGILGKLISIPAVEMVFYRTLLAALGMGVFILAVNGKFKVTSGDLLKLLLTGCIVGIHWLTFFISGRVANVSVSLVGFATASLWTAILEPLVKKYPIRNIDLIFGLIVLTGLYIIFSSDFSYSLGLILGVASGLTCAIFSIINSQLVMRMDATTITFYEMSGACIFLVLFFPLYKAGWAGGNQLRLVPNWNDWIYIGLLAWLCSVYAYSASVQLMKKISVFLFQLTLNLEPVYGIAMAVLVFGEVEKMNLNFYVGTAIIMIVVFLYPMMRRRFTTSPTSSAQENK